MTDNNRDRNSSGENWDKNQGRYVDDNNYNQHANYNRPEDLDRDGFIGNANNNYNDWNNNQKRNYDRRGDYNQGDYNRENRNYDSYQNRNQYGNAGYEGNQDYRNSGQQNYGGNYGSSYDSRGDYNRNYENTGNYNSSRQNYESGYSNKDRNYDNNRNHWPNQGDNRNNRREGRDWWDKASDEVSSWFGDKDAERRRRMDERMEGTHKGKGPKDYRRSDDRIREDVCDRLSDDSYVDASDIDVKVQNCEVTLDGTVPDRNAKRRAEDLVESISGVAHVQNNLRVGNPATVGSSVIKSSNINSGNDTNKDQVR